VVTLTLLCFIFFEKFLDMLFQENDVSFNPDLADLPLPDIVVYGPGAAAEHLGQVLGCVGLML
jgi:hypothetical protein